MAKILIVDDDSQIRNMLNALFTKKGYIVELASNGIEGMKVAQRFKPDLVLTDIFMPEQEGFQTVLDIKRKMPQVKVIVMSGGGELFDASQYLKIANRFGAEKAFQKPIDLNKLLQDVQELLK